MPRSLLNMGSRFAVYVQVLHKQSPIISEAFTLKPKLYKFDSSDLTVFDYLIAGISENLKILELSILECIAV